MSDFLENMAISSRKRSAVAAARMPLEKLKGLCENLPPTKPFPDSSDGLGVIAEIKVRSPAEGQLAERVDLNVIIDRAQSYVAGGAGVLSVLTEPERFDGKLEYLTVVADTVANSAVAVMRKDFLVDEYQLYEARVAGADGVLLIARILDDEQLETMIQTAKELGLFVLLEAFDEDDLARSSVYASAQVPIGLNCRDLTTLKIDPARFAALIDKFPVNAVKVAESGIHSPDDGQRVKKLGYDFALIGTALMKAACATTMIQVLSGAQPGKKTDQDMDLNTGQSAGQEAGQ